MKKPLIIAGLLVFLMGGCVVGTVAVVLDRIKESPPYTQALELAQKDPRVLAELGAPVRPAWYVLGSITLQDGDKGQADLVIPLLGSKRIKGTPHSGRLHVTAAKAGGAWTLKTAELVTMTGPDTFATLPLLP